MKNLEHRVPFFADNVENQTNNPYPDDLTMQEPDEIFLTELIQKTEEEANAIQQSVIGKIHGHIRNVNNVTINKTQFKKPVETQFALIESGGRLNIARFNKDVHGPWNDIPDTNLTPVEFISWYKNQEEPTPGLLTEFINTRKQQSASKMHWEPSHHPKPKTK